MDAVRSADHQRIFVGEGLFFQGGEQRVDPFQQDVRCFFQQNGERGIENIG